MPNMLERSAISTNPYMYKGVSKYELGFGDEATKSRYFDFVSPETGQLTGVFVTEPRAEIEQPNGESVAHRRTIIYPQSHEYRNEPSSMARLQQLATAFDARVVGVETVGTTGLMQADENGRAIVRTELRRLDGDRQTVPQLLGALRGDFRLHASKQLEAIEGTIGMNETTRYTLFGESMGAAVATDMLGLMKQRGYTVDEIVMYEMVNAFEGRRPLLPVQLMRVLPGEENNRRNQYIQENTDIGHPMTAFELVNDEQQRLDIARKKLGQQGRAGLVNGLGMAIGRSAALQDSLDYFEKNDAPLLTMVRGRESLATSDNDYRCFTTQFTLGGYAVRMFEVADTEHPLEARPMGHSHLFSLGRGKDIYETLAKR